MTGLWFGKPCHTLWGFVHLLDLEQDQTGNGVESFWGEGIVGGFILH